MAIDPFLTGIASAGISSAAGLLGGFMNRGLSQRDAMQAQSEFALRQYRDQLKQGPRWEQQGLARAGINPMLPFAKGGAVGPTGFTPGIAPPINPGQDFGRAVSAGLSSAGDLARTTAGVQKTFAEISQIAASIKQTEASTSLTVQQKANAVAEQRRIFADEVLKIGQAVLNSEQVKNLEAHREVLNSQAAINKWLELSEKARSELQAAGVPLAEADADFYESWFGEFLRWIERSKAAINPFQKGLR